MSSFEKVKDEFENWIDTLTCTGVDDGSEPYCVVYGLVTVGVYLMWKYHLEEHRSELMGMYGTDWFTLDQNKWAAAKKAIYSHVDSAA